MRLQNSSVTNNSATSGNGGGIFNLSAINDTALEIIDSTIDHNTALGASASGWGRGGGIYNEGKATIRATGNNRTNITTNRAQNAGGGIYNAGGAKTIVSQTLFHQNRVIQGTGAGIHNASFVDATALDANRVTISGNFFETTGTGGGLHNFGNARLRNTTFSGNQATSGAAIFDDFLSTIDLDNVTIAQNTAQGGGGSSAGGGILSAGGAVVNVVNTIIAGNAAELHPDVSGQVVSLGHNLVGDGTGSFGFTAPGDQVGTSASPIDPMLSPLGDYGGPTPTHILLEGSPALDAGDDSFAALPVDQRGYARIMGGAVDIGAVEMEVGEALRAGRRTLRAIPVSRRLR